MNSLKLVIITFLIFGLSSCSSIKDNNGNSNKSHVLSGTKTAVVGIPLDSNGTPKATVPKIILFPGQKVLFAGPDDFSIFFKNRKTPNKIIENVSSRGTVIIAIPENILEQPDFIEEFRKNNSLTFKYGIRVNGKELDPEIVIKRGN